jgi:hypothetical protein
MRSISLVFVCLIAIATLPLTAESLRNDRHEDGTRVRVVRIIRSIFGVRTNSDALTPPLPAVPPHP